MSEDSNDAPDGWDELFSCVATISDALNSAVVAFGPETSDKTFSATTRKRLAQKSLQTLDNCKGVVKLLNERLGQLKQASEHWSLNIQYASKSQEELITQLERTSKELQDTIRCLRTAEAERVQTTMDLQQAEVQLAQSELAIQGYKERLQDQERACKEARNAEDNAQKRIQQMLKEQAVLTTEAETMRSTAHEASSCLQSAKEEAAKAGAVVQRHQAMVAKLTADNLVFLMQLRKAEAELDAAKVERTQLLLAVEQQQGPWFNQVRAGVEERVKHALQRAEDLEIKLEAQQAQHAKDLESSEATKQRLEQQIAQLQQQVADLMEQIKELERNLSMAEKEAITARTAEKAAKQHGEDVEAELRVMQQSSRQLREECNERWFSEKKAVDHAALAESKLDNLSSQISNLQLEMHSLQQELQTQQGVNNQLMVRKEQVEWQLMSALARLNSSSNSTPPITRDAAANATTSNSNNPAHARSSSPNIAINLPPGCHSHFDTGFESTKAKETGSGFPAHAAVKTNEHGIISHGAAQHADGDGYHDSNDLTRVQPEGVSADGGFSTTRFGPASFGRDQVESHGSSSCTHASLPEAGRNAELPADIRPNADPFETHAHGQDMNNRSACHSAGIDFKATVGDYISSTVTPGANLHIAERNDGVPHTGSTCKTNGTSMAAESPPQSHTGEHVEETARPRSAPTNVSGSVGSSQGCHFRDAADSRDSQLYGATHTARNYHQILLMDQPAASAPPHSNSISIGSRKNAGDTLTTELLPQNNHQDITGMHMRQQHVEASDAVHLPHRCPMSEEDDINDTTAIRQSRQSGSGFITSKQPDHQSAAGLVVTAANVPSSSHGILSIATSYQQNADTLNAAEEAGLATNRLHESHQFSLAASKVPIHVRPMAPPVDTGVPEPPGNKSSIFQASCPNGISFADTFSGKSDQNDYLNPVHARLDASTECTRNAALGAADVQVSDSATNPSTPHSCEYKAYTPPRTPPTPRTTSWVPLALPQALAQPASPSATSQQYTSTTSPPSEATQDLVKKLPMDETSSLRMCVTRDTSSTGHIECYTGTCFAPNRLPASRLSVCTSADTKFRACPAPASKPKQFKDQSPAHKFTGLGDSVLAAPKPRRRAATCVATTAAHQDIASP